MPSLKTSLQGPLRQLLFSPPSPAIRTTWSQLSMNAWPSTLGTSVMARPVVSRDTMLLECLGREVTIGGGPAPTFAGATRNCGTADRHGGATGKARSG